MASRNIEIKVGLLVVIGTAIIIFAVWLAKGYRYGQEYYTVSILFPEVGALSTGDPVAVSGVNKGKVTKIRLSEGEVLVDVDFAEDVELKEDASFIVKNIGLMGERFISVKTGKSSEKLDLTKPARGAFDPGIPEVMGMMGDVIANMSDLVDLLEKTVISPQTLDKFSETVTNLRDITNKLERATNRNIPKIDSTVDNFSDLARQLNQSVKRNQAHLDSGAKNFDDASKRLVALLSDMEDASAKLKAFANDLDQSDGTLRLLMEDRRLYDDMRSTAHNLDSLINDIRANPKKYINFTVEIF